MTEYKYFRGVPDQLVEVGDRPDGWRCSASPGVVAQCEKLRQAAVDYAASVENGIEHIDQPDVLNHQATHWYHRAKKALIFAVYATASCNARTLADLALKQVALDPCMTFCREHPRLTERIAASLLLDIAQVVGKPPTIAPSWKFPAIHFPASWSMCSKLRSANGTQT